MKLSVQIKIIFCASIIFFSTTQLLFAQQATTEKFGQNRVQLRTFDWQYYDTTHFRIMYYDYGKYNAQYLLQQAEADLPAIVFMMGAKLPDKIDVVVYNSYSDYKQTNIGRYNDELAESVNGLAEVNRNTIVVFFDGTHDGMRKQIRKGIAKIIKDNLLFGYTLKDIVKNAVSMNLPPWYTNGYVDYIAEDWDAAKLSKLKSILNKNQKRKFVDISAEYPTLVGHSFFHFLAEAYSQNAINNLLYYTRSRKPVDKALELVFQKKEKELQEQWKLFYTTPNDTTLTDTTAARKLVQVIKPKQGAILKQFAMSPDGGVLAYAQVLDGQYTIQLMTVANGKSTTIIEGGIRNSVETKDPNYPIICWNTDGKKLAVMYEKDYYQRLKIYDAKNGRTSDRIITKNKFDRINGMCFMEDDDKMVMSCIKKGQSDLYQFTIKNARLYQVTKDIWDDVAPTFVRGNGLNGIVFLSNRPKAALQAPIRNDELPNLPMQMYYYDDINANSIVCVSKNVNAVISQPLQYGKDNLAFLADVNGKKTRYIRFAKKMGAAADSIYYIPNNDIDYSIVHHNYLQQKNAMVDIVDKRGKYYIYQTPISYLDTMDAFKQVQGLLEIQGSKKPVQKPLPDNANDVYFLSEFENDIDSLVISKPKKDPLAYDPSVFIPKRFRSKPYQALFTTDYLQTSIDNSLLFNKYQKVDMGNGLFKYPEIGPMVRLSLMDVLEDYKISAGIRVPYDLSFNMAYQIKFANYKRRIDWEVAFAHTADTMLKYNGALPVTDPFYSPKLEYAKQTQNSIIGTFTYPFNITTALRLETSFRQDQLKYKALNEYSLRFPTIAEYWWFNKIEYIYDNTIRPYENIYKGTKLKIYGDAFIQLNGAKTNTFVAGIDARYYKGIYKNIIWATRFASATSFGKSKLLYRIGGIDNEIIPKQNPDVGMIDDANFGYQTPVTNMRGYLQNSRNGRSFAVINEEIRIPVMNSLTNRVVKSKMLRQLQLVGFVDVGSAWGSFFNGPDDYRYTKMDSLGNTITVLVPSTMLGYGGGIRTTILGYFIHADIGWNPDRKQSRLSIGMQKDF
jgi:hypothetical protein